MIAPDFRMAILQPREGGDSVRVRVGTAPEAAPGWRLVSLEPRRAVFDGPEGERKLELRVFDGEGGIPPTATSARSEEHTSELQSLMRTSYAVFCLKKKKTITHKTQNYTNNTIITK